MGYSRVFFDYGTYELRDENHNLIETFHSWDRSTDFSIGLSLNYFLRTSAGVTFKNIESHLSSFTAKVNARDWGILFEIPFLQIAQRTNLLPNNFKTILPFFTPMFSYSICNIGDKVVYLDENQADPLPRTARVGIGYEGGIVMPFDRTNWRILSVKWAVEEEDLLIKKYQVGSWKYRSGLADIDPLNDLIANRSNSRAIKHKGWEINLFDFIMFRNGKYEDIDGDVCYRTWGTGFNLSGALQIIQIHVPRASKSSMMNFLANHVDVQYHTSWVSTRYSVFTWTIFKGITITLK